MTERQKHTASVCANVFNAYCQRVNHEILVMMRNANNGVGIATQQPMFFYNQVFRIICPIMLLYCSEDLAERMFMDLCLSI